ncbi:UxaA family hydrolase [Halomarina pelagica]|uniref:UxaA family hydrolase n=1 Tax=Halomarina pelagica TaxID=2961599 RepID=UPI0020C42D31|nr:UxaA family hydrolase [Halomarina sp. BND7]
MKGEVLDDVALLMTTDDVVATAIDDLEAGREVDVGDRTLVLGEDVEFGHKFALVDLATGEDVVKYGEVIGRASEPIAAGDWVHVHNCESTRGRGDLEIAEGGESA